MDPKIKLFLIGLLLLLSFACEQKPTQPSTNIKIETNSQMEIKEMLNNLKTQMLNYIEFGQPAYSEKDVETCIHLIEAFLSNIDKSESKESGMKLVKELMLNLNNLNRACKGSLIETDQRELICPIIISACHQKGYNEADEDITLEWREW